MIMRARTTLLYPALCPSRLRATENTTLLDAYGRPDPAPTGSTCSILRALLDHPRREKDSKAHLSFVCHPLGETEASTCDAEQDDDEAHRQKSFEW